ncbi:HAD family hydrolase [Hymenobacter terrenus]|uniref:HAD family hydrolase n=1 Tax=Hymenobacter terrenus TaxID=1629124 RepID=UPI0006197232|nr:HAD family hydrolase [Hymenobacter terrenus]
MDTLQIIAFDADDTLWVNEPHYQHMEQQFGELLADFLPPHAAAQELFKTEMQNLALYGYGAKGFVLCMVETAVRVSAGAMSMPVVEKILDYGKALLNQPVELLDGVEDVLEALQGRYRLVVATKGDLLDQERKLKKSGLERYFHHIEIMSDKQPADYRKLLKHLDIPASDFLMVGNSLRSDILPVLDLGGHAWHVPFHTTWEHERVEQLVAHPKLQQLTSIRQVPERLLAMRNIR